MSEHIAGLLMFLKAILGFAIGLFTLTAEAQWPARPMTWVVPFAAGGATDVMAREIAQRVGDNLKQSIVIENVPGAGGTLGSAKVAKAPGDGYTFLVGHLGYISAAPSLYKQLPYQPMVDLVPVVRFPDTPLVLVVSATSRFKTLSDLIEYARQNPGKLNVANAGVGSTSHLIAALFTSRLNIKTTDIPYKGIAPAVTDLIGGSVDVVFDQTNTALGYVHAGKTRALAVTSAAAMPQFPEARPVSDVLPGFEAVTWYGLYAPKGTPPEIIELVHQAYLKAIADSQWQASLSARGMRLLPAIDYSPARFGAHTVSEIERWRAVVRQAGIQPQ
jgi:tripartite-type tricarboxylate transporter receptor subunit TctC